MEPLVARGGKLFGIQPGKAYFHSRFRVQIFVETEATFLSGRTTVRRGLRYKTVAAAGLLFKANDKKEGRKEGSLLESGVLRINRGKEGIYLFFF